MKTIKTKLSEKSYQILIGENALNSLIDKINSLSVTKCLFIVDKNVEKYHSKLIRIVVASLNCNVYKYTFYATELNKNLIQTNKIYKYLSDNHFDRNSVIVSVGGGITGDVSAFVASTFMRGINYFQVPTTLLAMVDSSVGGKTGVNFDKRKNLIGTFYQPDGVFVYTGFLDSLPDKEILSGSGEVLKYAFLSNEKNYILLKNNLKKIFNNHTPKFDKTIQTCLMIKSNIVSIDEKEISGLRKILNLGHTFAHAFEVQSKYVLRHGEAVIGGIFCALFLSEKLGYLSNEKLNKFLKDFNFVKPGRSILNLDIERIYQSMIGDKKNLSGKIKLVLLEDIGKIIVDVSTDKAAITDSINRMKSLI